MYRLTFVFILLLSIQSSLFTQNEHNTWYFGSKVGLNFNSGSPVFIQDGELDTYEACATISDASGKLLFYTDGVSVWDSSHVVMPNGSGLMGDLTSTQVAIVKQPGSSTKYYIFTVDDTGGANGFRYTKVDMSLQGGMGDVETNNKNIAITTQVTEKIAVIKHQNNVDYWIVVHKLSSNEFHSYLLSNSGLSLVPVVTNIGSSLSVYVGYIKASIDGSKIALANGTLDNVELFDFDNSTGVLSNTMTFTNFNTWGPYGLEFSPNGRFLYVSEASNPISNIYQYDLAAGNSTNINQSRVVVGSHTTTSQQGGGALQLGPDHKIYHARAGEVYVGAINNPDSLGVQCNYNDSQIYVGVYLSVQKVWLGLPTFENTINKINVGVDNINAVKAKVVLYPNPATNNVNVYCNTTINKIELLNIQGQLLFTTKNKTLLVDKLPKGIYFLKIYIDNQLVMKRFIKH